jgi:hypothetical protein
MPFKNPRKTGGSPIGNRRQNPAEVRHEPDKHNKSVSFVLSCLDRTQQRSNKKHAGPGRPHNAGDDSSQSQRQSFAHWPAISRSFNDDATGRNKRRKDKTDERGILEHNDVNKFVEHFHYPKLNGKRNKKSQRTGGRNNFHPALKYVRRHYKRADSD